jgi:hypothetical protein
MLMSMHLLLQLQMICHACGGSIDRIPWPFGGLLNEPVLALDQRICPICWTQHGEPFTVEERKRILLWWERRRRRYLRRQERRTRAGAAWMRGPLPLLRLRHS